MVRVLHTEASVGWGGQEIRILQECIAMRDKGHQVLLVVEREAKLGQHARKHGFLVHEVSFSYSSSPKTIFKLVRLIIQEKIEIMNTHSSLDAWIAGIAARLTRCKIVRTRHISAKIKPGLNSRALYHFLADFTVTTCEEVAEVIRRQASLTTKRCRSIPTGIQPNQIKFTQDEVSNFKAKHNLKDEDFIIGTACILRSWKGIEDLIHAATLTKKENIKWVIVGNGPGFEYYQKQAMDKNLNDRVIFTDFLENPYFAIASFDVFAMLSTANEGVSQATLQGAFLEKPLITTPTGGLREICVDGLTGYSVPINSPGAVAEKVQFFSENRHKAHEMGKAARELVLSEFTFERTLHEVEKVYNSLTD
ncbi:MAG: glycosyltransferase family 4 protein [Chlamydiales bacterium]